jgi:hypothetical protein
MAELYFALGIVAESPQHSEDLKRIALTQGNAQIIKKKGTVHITIFAA